MANLIVTRGPLVGHHFHLSDSTTILGRDNDVAVALESLAVSRRHARIQCESGNYVVQDLGSSNGTFLNGHRLEGPVPLSEGDLIQIGPYVLKFRAASGDVVPETDLVIREEVGADLTDKTLYTRDPARLLEAVLTVGRQLAGSLDLQTLLERLLDQLFVIFPQADRALVLLCQDDELSLQARRSRRPKDHAVFSFSRTIVHRALDEGLGVLSEDVRADLRFRAVETVAATNMRSVVCVPLIGAGQRRLGVVQVDCLEAGQAFRLEDLQLLTVLALHVSASLENAALHAELVREERIRHELALARQMQQGFLPPELPSAPERPYVLCTRLRPAREVAGDLYDFSIRPDGLLGFLIADVSGKGIPAALFMLAVRTLARHPAAIGARPSEVLRQLNASLAPDNRSGIFVTATCGLYEPSSGTVHLACCGHPAPLLRRASGQVEVLPVEGGVPLGMLEAAAEPAELSLAIHVGDSLVLYTDGITEAIAPDGDSQFGLERLRDVLADPCSAVPRDCAARLESALDQFTKASEPQDDQTLLILQRIA